MKGLRRSTADEKDVHWEKLTIVGSDVDALMIAETLAGEGIPCLRQSPTAGIFGYGFAAETPEGITLLVPSDRIDEAKSLLASSPGL